MPDTYSLVRPLLLRLDPERAHELTLRALEIGLGPRIRPPADPRLHTRFLGRSMPHPLGLAAGFDKNARVIVPLIRMGFSSVEVGGVTPKPQLGNARPRVFRLSDEEAVINRMGFPNDGLEKVLPRLHRAQNRVALLGVNLASNADSADPVADFVVLAQRFAPFADYLTLDISCPNTGNGQIFLDPKRLRQLLGALAATDFGERRPRFVAKLSPDIEATALGRLLEVLEDCAIDALCISNTTVARAENARGVTAERGGLSGRPLFAASTAMVQAVFRNLEHRIPIIGTGGIASGSDAYAKIRAGARSLQIYTALIYQGPAAINRILTELSACLQQDGFSSIGDAVGVGL